jgi:hypothetical protein
MKSNKLKIGTNKEFLLKNFIPFNPDKISNEDDNIYVFCQLITGFDKDKDNVPFVYMKNDVITINKLKSSYYAPLYYVNKRDWERLQTTHGNIYITLIETDKYNEYTK